jgi:colanic acid biosynthesis glycosyl transferase WcaI
LLESANPSLPAMRAVSKAKMQTFVVVSQHYPPDPSTTVAIMAAISEAWRRKPKSWCSRERRAPPRVRPPASLMWMPAKAALVRCALAQLLFTVRVFIALLMKLRRGDVALTVPAPFMLPYAFAAAAKLKGAKSVLIMHDLYPDVLIMAGLAEASVNAGKGDARLERADVSRA